jgi:hypothetical protein
MKIFMLWLLLLPGSLCRAQSFIEERELLMFFDRITGETDNAESCEKFLKANGENFSRQKNTLTIIAPSAYYNYMDLHADSSVCQVTFIDKAKHIDLTDSLVRMNRAVIAMYKSHKTAGKDLKRLCRQFNLKMKKSGERTYSCWKNVYLPVKDGIYMSYTLQVSLDKYRCRKKCRLACGLLIGLVQNF